MTAVGFVLAPPNTWLYKIESDAAYCQQVNAAGNNSTQITDGCARFVFSAHEIREKMIELNSIFFNFFFNFFFFHVGNPLEMSKK